MTVSGGEEEDALNLDLELRSTVGRGDEQKGENRKKKKRIHINFNLRREDRYSKSCFDRFDWRLGIFDSPDRQ